MKAQFIDPIDPISLTRFPATFKLECDTETMYEGSDICVLPFFVTDTLATTVNCHMSAATRIKPVVDSVNTTEPLIKKKLLQSYPEVVNYLLRKFVSDQMIAKMDYKTLRYIQSAHMTPMHYADDLYANSSKVADVHDKSAFNDIFLEGVDPSISQPPEILGYALKSRSY